MNEQETGNIYGYIEGYYGRLLTWTDRLKIVSQLSSLGMSHYFYAPKEDVNHRLYWRQPYDQSWRSEFQQFCRRASELGIHVIAGVAPGLDFDFADLDFAVRKVQRAQHSRSPVLEKNDFSVLLNKAQQLLADGADGISLLMDDIDEDFHTRAGSFGNEGEAHAQLANRLGEELASPLWVVPRAYADDIAVSAPSYLPAFVATLNAGHSIVHCGAGIIAEHVSNDILHSSIKSDHAIVVWDNLYANDYCPRRLFLGPYVGREASLNILLNPTGWVETDCLLLALMQATLRSEDAEQAWSDVFTAHEVPIEFLLLAPYFGLPAFKGKANAIQTCAGEAHFAALEKLLWKWKTPLSREWYPWLMALKQDLLIAKGRVSEDRIYKIQLAPLAAALCQPD